MTNFWHCIHRATKLLDVASDGTVFIIDREEWDALWDEIRRLGYYDLIRPIVEAKADAMRGYP